MGFSEFFGFRSLASATEVVIPEIFPLALGVEDFVDTEVENIYAKILTDCIERIQGFPDELLVLLWDNCLQSESTDGLITFLSWAMANMEDLFLVYKGEITLLREATDEEAKQIKIDYENKGQSSIGIFVSFKNFKRTDMIRIYSSMEYAVVASLNKMMNLSKSIQFKMSDMRGTVSLTDSAVAIDQAKAIADQLRAGKDILIDKNDDVTTNSPDISSIKESISFLDSKKSFYYGMPLSYINGEQTPGIGSTGEADSNAVERGLRQYYISVLKPVIEVLFGIKTSFKSNNFRQIGSALEALKTFELVEDDLISLETKRLILSRLFEVQDNMQGEPRQPVSLTTASLRG
jgi:hypothetical protein